MTLPDRRVEIRRSGRVWDAVALFDGDEIDSMSSGRRFAGAVEWAWAAFPGWPIFHAVDDRFVRIEEKEEG